jgi:mannose-6-phosphate isomerase-like protein (cupin superfamily)
MKHNKVIPIFTSSIEIVIPSHASNNTLCVFIETAPPGGGPPPHRHDREDEVFTVLEGEFEFYTDGVWSPFSVDETRLSLRGNYHAFRNVGSTPGRMMLMTNGGGIDEYFTHISDLRLPQDLDRLAEISSHYGYYYLPPAERVAAK